MNVKAILTSSVFVRSILVISLFVLIFIFSISYKHTIAFTESTELLVHSYKIQIKLEQLLSYLKDAETGQRGYIISSDPIFLEPYKSAQERVNESFADLKELIEYNLRQQSNMDSLQVLMNLRFKLLAISLELNSKPDINRALLDQNLIKGKKVMDSIRTKINSMIDLEAMNFKEHQKKYTHELYFTPNINLFILLFSLIVVVLSFIKINSDFGKLKERNEDLRITTESFKSAEIALEAQNRELELRNKELASFNHIASHDLQEPLRKIQTFISRISEKESSTLSENGKEYFMKIQESVKRMRNLINDLLLFSRTSKVEKKFAEADLNILFDNAKLELLQDIEDKSAVIHSVELPVLNVIPFQIQQLFINLLGNSLKYSKPGIAPVINIVSEVVDSNEYAFLAQNNQEKYYKISIEDNGLGFEQEFAEEIFLLFYRLHSKSVKEGSGIGLSICKKIVENHNGFISARGNPGTGSVFSFFLPALYQKSYRNDS
jgi:signal transduction histidine kinase